MEQEQSPARVVSAITSDNNVSLAIWQYGISIGEKERKKERDLI